jgi:hypothetical protein
MIKSFLGKNLKLDSQNKILNMIGFQLCWWSIAIYKEKSIFIVVLLLFAHFIFLKKNKLKELIFVLSISSLGITCDTLMYNLNFFYFSDYTNLHVTIIPFWLILLWFAFASTLNHSLDWLFKSRSMAFAIGGLGGALSYIAAANLGALKFNLSNPYVFTILFFVWGILFLIFKVIKNIIYK